MSISGDASWIDQATYKVALTTQQVRVGKILFDALPPVAFQAGWKQTISGTTGGILRVKFGDETNYIELELVHGTTSTYNLYHNTTLVSSVSSVNMFPGAEVEATYKQVNSYATFKLNNVTIFNEVDLQGKVLTYENGVMEATGLTYANQNTTQIINDMFLVPITEFQDDVYIARGIYAEQYFNLPISPQVQADWNQTDVSSNSYIKNKPTLATVATTGDYGDLLNRPDFQSLTDLFNSYSSSLADVALSGDYNDLSNKPSSTFNGGTITTSLFVNNSSPIIGFQQTDGLSAFIQMNGSTFRVQRAEINGTTASNIDNRSPLAINLTNNYTTLGGILATYGNIAIISGDTSYTYCGPNSGGYYLIVGASQSYITLDRAQLTAHTDGNLYLDCAYGKTLYINNLSQRPTNIMGSLTVEGGGYFKGYLQVDGNLYCLNGYPLSPKTSEWHRSTEGIDRFYFVLNGSTYFKTGNAFLWYNSSGISKMALNGDGNFSISHNNGNSVYFNGDATQSLTYFTGQHRSFTQDDDLFKNAYDYKGLIVVSTGEYVSETDKGIMRGKEAITMDDAMPLIELSSQARQKSVYGVVSTIEKGEERVMTGEGMRMKVKKGLGEHRIIINSLGEGSIWVCDEGGILENGDLICSSSVSGYGMKQEDDLMRNYTVAKITMNCDFNPRLVSKKVLLKDEEGKNILDENGMIQFVDSDETEYQYEMRWLMKDGSRITKQEYDTLKEQRVDVYRCAFVGCTYHCG